MPQFYETDDLYAWVRASITEYLENCDCFEYINNNLNVRKDFKDCLKDIKEFWTESVMMEIDQTITIKTLQSAIINTIDWADMKADVLHDLGLDEPCEIEKEAGREFSLQLMKHGAINMEKMIEILKTGGDEVKAMKTVYAELLE